MRRPCRGATQADSWDEAARAPSSRPSLRLRSVIEFVDNPDVRVPEPEKATAVAIAVAVAGGDSSVSDLSFKDNMGDAPAGSNCGHMTVRNGS